MPRWRRQAAGEPEFKTTASVDLTLEREDVLTRFIVPIERTANGVIYDATSTDPQFELGLPPFAPSSVRAVRFRMRRDTSEPAVAQLFWAYGPEEDFSERCSATVFLDPTAAGWREYRFRLDRPAVRERWLGGDRIARLRFDPANVPGRFELASLILES
jgi:hypothetical protein